MHFLNPTYLADTFGTLGIVAVIFAESCFAFFLPGDSLLFTAGLLAGQNKFGLNPWLIAILAPIAAVIGNQVGYAFGNKVGPALFKRPDSRFFKQEYLEKSEHYFAKYGPKTIMLARFIPIVRTFAPMVAGAGKMRYRTFIAYNVAGGVLWASGVTILGWVAGKSLGADFPIDKYLLPMIALIILISISPAIYEYRKGKKAQLE